MAIYGTIKCFHSDNANELKGPEMLKITDSMGIGVTTTGSTAVPPGTCGCAQPIEPWRRSTPEHSRHPAVWGRYQIRGFARISLDFNIKQKKLPYRGGENGCMIKMRGQMRNTRIREDFPGL